MKWADGNGNLEIIFYIIAAIVGLAVNAYRNYSKKKAGEMKGPVEEEPDFPEVLFEPVIPKQEYMWEEEINEETGQTQEWIESREEDEGLMEKVEVTDNPKIPEGVAALNITREQLNPDNLTEDDSPISDFFSKEEIYTDKEISDSVEEDLSEEDAFDLRKAVIYSEILNPKYINNNY